MKTEDLLMIGALGLGAYLVLGPLNKGLQTAADAAGNTVGTVGNTVGSALSPISTAGDQLSKVLKSEGNLVTGFLDNLSAPKSSSYTTTNYPSNGPPTTSTSTAPPIINANSSNVAMAQTAANYAGATYNASTGVLITASGTGYSVAPQNVPTMLKQVSNSGSTTYGQGAANFLASYGYKV